MGSREITTAEAIAWCLDPRNDNWGGSGRGIVHVMAANYDPNGEEGEYDGLTPDDVVTWTSPSGIDASGFAEWGPFILAWEDDEDPVEPREWLPREAVTRLTSFIEVFEADGADPTLRIAIDVLGAFVEQVLEHGSPDLEWGVPGDCWDRIQNDTDLRDTAGLPPNGLTDIEETAMAIKAGLGRHYGDPHCIWCSQAS